MAGLVWAIGFGFPGHEVAIDSSVIEAYGSPRRGADPDASWTAKSRKKAGPGVPEKEWFYGFKLHAMVDSRYEIPLAFHVTTASRNDTLELRPLMEQAQTRHSWFKPHAVSSDKGCDSQANHKYLYGQDILPIIALREKRLTQERLGIFTKNGIPTCLGNKPMQHIATGGNGHRLYRCAVGGCHLKGQLGGGSHHGCDDEFWLDPREDLRLCGAIERTSPQWKYIYSRRQSVERFFKTLKQDLLLTNHRRMGLAAVRLHALISVMVYQAWYLAQKHQGVRDGRPWMVRRVA